MTDMQQKSEIEIKRQSQERDIFITLCRLKRADDGITSLVSIRMPSATIYLMYDSQGYQKVVYQCQGRDDPLWRLVP
jgi:hypothetical protein